MNAIFDFVTGFIDFVFVIVIYAVVMLFMLVVVIVASPWLAWVLAHEMLTGRRNVTPQTRK